VGRADWKITAYPDGHSAAVSSVAFSSDNATHRDGQPDKTVRLWDAATGQSVRQLDQLHSSSARYRALHFRRTQIIRTGTTRRLKSGIRKHGKPIRQLPGHTDLQPVLALADSQYVISEVHGTARIWDTAAHQLAFRGLCALCSVDLSAL
jgi:WD40 repeat protein